MTRIKALLAAAAVAATVVTATASVTADGMVVGEPTQHPAKVTVPD